jgi:hypothetical protein
MAARRALQSRPAAMAVHSVHQGRRLPGPAHPIRFTGKHSTSRLIVDSRIPPGANEADCQVLLVDPTLRLAVREPVFSQTVRLAKSR